MEIIVYIIIFIMGAFIGSFASLAVYRIPIKEDILIKHSYCPNCKAKLVLKDLVPIFSYIFLRGRCSHCGEKIRPRYLILEVLSGVLFLLFFLSFDIDLYNFMISDMVVFLFITIFLTTLIILAGIDKENRKIENSIIFFEIIVSAIYVIYMYTLNINVLYDVIIILAATVFFAINKYFIKSDENKYIMNFIILIMLTKIFVNPYILLFSVVLAVLTGVFHSRAVKTEIPLAFYYTIYFVSIFIGSNFLI